MCEHVCLTAVWLPVAGTLRLAAWIKRGRGSGEKEHDDIVCHCHYSRTQQSIRAPRTKVSVSLVGIRDDELYLLLLAAEKQNSGQGEGHSRTLT